MDSLLEEQSAFMGKGDLSSAIRGVDETISLLQDAYESIQISPADASITLAKLQNPAKQSFDGVNKALKEVHKALGDYSKALDRKFKDKYLSASDSHTFAAQESLINRAIGMHFLREGQFAVASAFMEELPDLQNYESTLDPRELRQVARQSDEIQTNILREQFAEMYHILGEMKNNKNLDPATRWARANSASLEARGSNLEFELGKLQFVWLFFAGHDSMHARDLSARQRTALAYARKEFSSFQDRHLREIQQLVGAMAFCPNLMQSPYKHIFFSDGAWENLAVSFTREFCSLLGLSADSPLYIAATAGAIALPTLQKLRLIMEKKRTEWTTQNELPVEVPLPPSYRFHSIFVCPVSKEQTTDSNPPMMLPCGHVIAQESLQRLSKVSRFKCPYCPGESHSKDAKKVFL